MKIGQFVTFNADKVASFIKETSGDSPAIRQYQKLVLGGVNQIGVIKELGQDLTTVSYPDGWDLPVPTKYLVVLPDDEK